MAGAPAVTGSPRWRRPILAVLLVAAAMLCARGITDESSAMLGADMARYVMNGVFLRDLAADGGVSSVHDLTMYAERYYAQYPALSLGHHSPLPYFTLVPFFAVFGVSIFAARLAAVMWFVVAAWGLYAVATRLFDWRAASWAVALFITNEFVLRFGQYVLSEMPMVALVLLASVALLRFCDTRDRRALLWFGLAATASVYAKQTAAFMFPVYAAMVFTRPGWRELASRRLWMVFGACLLLAVLAIGLTAGLAPALVEMVQKNLAKLQTRGSLGSVADIVTTILESHLSWPILILAIAGGVALAVNRDRRAVVLGVWIACFFGGTMLAAGGTESARYAFGALPAYALLAASLVHTRRGQTMQRAAAAVLVAAVIWQSWQIRHLRPSGAGGYEAAAEYAVAASRQPAILFDGPVDTGYFIFFVRKHDPAGRFFVLRADKFLAPESNIDAMLKKFGVQFIVVEESAQAPPVRHELRRELANGRFVEHRRIPIVTTNPEAHGGSLVVYEFRDAQPPELDAELRIGIPTGNREIRIRVRDLIR